MTLTRRISSRFELGLITANSPSAAALLNRRYSCIVPNEAHRACQSGGIGNIGPNKLLSFMLSIAGRSDSVLLGTATPIQTDRGELYDLMRILNAGCGRVLGDIGSVWRSRDDALDMISGRMPIPDTAATAWAWLRDPLIPRGEHRTASRIRDELGLTDSEMSARTDAIDDLSPALRNGIRFDTDDLIRNHHPFVRHTIKRRRIDLKASDGSSYFPEIRIVLHGEDDEAAWTCRRRWRRPIAMRAHSATKSGDAAGLTVDVIAPQNWKFLGLIKHGREASLSR